MPASSHQTGSMHQHPGTAKTSPSRPMMEPIRSSVWRRARRNTARSVSAVRIAKGECQGCPPAVVRGPALHAAIASSVNQTVRLPRWRKAASYTAEFVTLRFCFGMWWRRPAFSLNGKAGIRDQEGNKPSMSDRLRKPPDGSVQQSRTGGSHRRVRDAEGRLAGTAQQPGRMPPCVSQRAGGLEDGACPMIVKQARILTNSDLL